MYFCLVYNHGRTLQVLKQNLEEKNVFMFKPVKTDIVIKGYADNVYPQRQNVTTSMVGLKNGHIGKNLSQNGEPWRSSWEMQKKKKKYHTERCNSRFFNNLLTAPWAVSNMYPQVARVHSCANHMQHIERLSCVTWRLTCHVVPRDSSTIKSDRDEIAFIWALFYLLNH